MALSMLRLLWSGSGSEDTVDAEQVLSMLSVDLNGSGSEDTR